MAPAAVNGDEAAVIGTEEISKPPAGVVLPPKDIRAILEKTAGYVARNGTAFEDRIREKEKHNPKFSFLNPTDAYGGFYAWRLSEIRAGRGTAIAAGRSGEAVAQAAEPEKPKGPTEPPAFHFSARMPNINAADLEVVRLTALFVARNGRQFMTTLSQREARNFQFDFLRPNHSLYQFFSRLVDQYTELLRYGSTDGEAGKAEKERMQELQKNVEDRFHLLGRAKQRAQWTKYQEQQKAKKEEEEEKEKLTYAQIDWHDFVIVETVLFTEADEQTELPAPTSLSDLQSASLEQKAMMSLAPHNMRIEEAMPTDDQPYQATYPTFAATQPQATLPMAPPIQPAQVSLPPDVNMVVDGPVFDAAPAAEEGDEAQRIRERAEERARARQAQTEAKGATAPMKIRSDYVPRAAANRRGVQMALCPNCKQQMPFNELDEHMRIELLDPRWKEQKAKADSRYATTNLSTQDVANNLKRLASQRSDVFDASISGPSSAAPPAGSKSSAATTAKAGTATPEGTGSTTDDDAARRKRVALPGAVYYDGLPETRDAFLRAQQHLPPQHMQSANVEEQIRMLHEKYGKPNVESG